MWFRAVRVLWDLGAFGGFAVGFLRGFSARALNSERGS